jgi:hypothetical protein
VSDIILGPDGKPAPEPEQYIETDKNGDPVRQGTLMLEKESYERVIEGLKMITDACAHLIKWEPENAATWRAYMTRFDKARRICVQYAGLGLAMKENETPEMRGEPMRWRLCRERFLDGVTQAAGGCRQIATCHRGDLWWTQMAETLDDMGRKLRSFKQRAPYPLPKHSLLLPTGYVRH